MFKIRFEFPPKLLCLMFKKISDELGDEFVHRGLDLDWDLDEIFVKENSALQRELNQIVVEATRKYLSEVEQQTITI